MKHQTSKAEISQILDEVAGLLKSQHASPFRINAYERAAEFIRTTQVDIVSLAINQQRKELTALPTIGKGIANLIIEFVHNSRSRLLNRLKGQNHPEELMEAIPGIGKQLAKEIVSQLNISTLEELEIAAHDGRLDAVKGFGEGRLKLVKLYLASLLSFRGDNDSRQRSAMQDFSQPSIGLILRLDQDYRQKAKEGKLRKIAPSRFNPTNAIWLPMYHVEQEGWHFTIMFSNTARAHELGKTEDWVIFFYEKDNHESQATVVTESRRLLKY